MRWPMESIYQSTMNIVNPQQILVIIEVVIILVELEEH